MFKEQQLINIEIRQWALERALEAHRKIDAWDVRTIVDTAKLFEEYIVPPVNAVQEETIVATEPEVEDDGFFTYKPTNFPINETPDRKVFFIDGGNSEPDQVVAAIKKLMQQLTAERDK